MSMTKWTLLSVATLLILILAFSSMYVVNEPDYGIVLQFGRVVTTHTEPGLYFKTPFVQSVIFFDKRRLEWDGESSDLLTVDKENIEVNTWARWRISDARKFYEALRTEAHGQGVLDAIITSSVKNVIAIQPIMEVLRNTQRRLKYSARELEETEASKNVQIKVGRESIVLDILAQASRDVEEQYGFIIDGVGIKHFNYVKNVIPKIYERMRSERIRIANRYESEGREAAAKILGEMKKDIESIESEGYKESTRIRGEADAGAIRIYAEAYGRDPDFYSFSRTLKAYPKILGAETRLVLGTDGSDLFRYLKTYRKLE